MVTGEMAAEQIAPVVAAAQVPAVGRVGDEWS
jgi:hypothetical protein